MLRSPALISQTLESLLTKLDNDNIVVVESSSPSEREKRPTAAFSSLAALVAIGQLLSSSKAEDLIERQLAELLAVLLKHLAGWLHVDPPMSIISTKFGFVPNRDTCKIVPHREVYNVLSKILNIIGVQEVANLSTEAVSVMVFLFKQSKAFRRGSSGQKLSPRKMSDCKR